MQTEETPVKLLSQKEPVLSLYTEDEIEGVSTTSSFTKSDTVATGQVSEVSSTSEDNCQLPSTTSSKSIFLDLYEEDIVDSESANVKDVKNNTSASSDVMEGKKPKPGLLLLGEYADSGNDTEEETLNSLRSEEKKTIENLSDKDGGTECATNKAVNDQNESSKKSVESDVINASSEVPPTVKEATSPVEKKMEDDKDFDVHKLLDDSLAKFERSVSKEEGQISAESGSSDSERSSDSRRDSKKQKDTKKDKSKKKDKKKKKKKRKKQKYSGEKKEYDMTEVKEKNVRKPIRSRSRESSVKRKSLMQSRSGSRDRDSRRRRRSRSRSQDKVKRSRHLKERSRRSRSRSTSRRRSAINRNKNLKSRSKSPKRSVSPFNRRRERRDRRRSTSRSRKDSPSARKRKVSRSRSPRKHRGGSLERRRSRSPRRRSRSPVKKRRTPERSPSQRSPSRKARSPNRRERKGSHSPPRKSSHRASSGSDSLDSGHFTTIPLAKTNKPVEFVLDNNEPAQKSSAIDEKEKEKESSIPPKSTDLEKQYSPSFSPEKPWEDEFDFVFTERMSPKQGTEKSMEDVLFGSEAKTPDFKRPTSGESKKSKTKESQHAAKKEETKTEQATETTDIVVTGNSIPQEVENQDVSFSLQPGSAASKSAIKVDEQGISNFSLQPGSAASKSAIKVDEQGISNFSLQSDSAASKSAIKADDQGISNSKDSKLDISVSRAAKVDIKDETEHVKKIDNDTDSEQCSTNSGKSAFIQSKLETIPFLGETPTIPPTVDRDEVHNAPSASQFGHLGPSPANTGLPPMPTLQGQTWRNLSEVGLLPDAVQKLNSNKNELEREKKDNIESFLTRNNGGRNIFNTSPMDMEMSSPEGDIIDRMNEEFWKQQHHHQSDVNKIESEANEQTSFEEPYEPESGLIIGEEYEEDLNNITDPKERRRREKEQQKEKTKVQELIDKLHRQARVEEEVKHALKAYYKHRDINKEEYKSILRRAVPQVTNSSSAIDPERIRSLVKKYVAKIKGERVHLLE